MNTNTSEMTEVAPRNNVFSSHQQTLMSAILHFLTGRRETFYY